MNIFKNTAAVGLLTGASLLAPAAEAAPVTDGASLAEALGLPVGGARFFWNEATQTSGQFTCETPSEQSVLCTLDVSSAGAQMDFTQTQTFDVGASGVAVTTLMQDSSVWKGDFRHTTLYIPYYEQASITSWAPESPLALNSPEGVVQNNIKMVEAGDDYKVKISSDVPISDNFGIRLTQVFDGNAGSI